MKFQHTLFIHTVHLHIIMIHQIIDSSIKYTQAKIKIHFYFNYSVYKQDSVEIINTENKKTKNFHQHNIRNSINHDNIWRHKNI